MSKLQELARKRNFAKMRLRGTLVTFTDLINSNMLWSDDEEFQEH